MEPFNTPKPKPISLIVLVIIISAFFLGKCSGGDTEPGYDFSEIEKRDSIIAAKDLKIGELTKRVNERDTVIVILTNKEEAQRDTVFNHLEDKFVGAPDSTKEALINEALNAIQ